MENLAGIELPDVSALVDDVKALDVAHTREKAKHAEVAVDSAAYEKVRVLSRTPRASPSAGGGAAGRARGLIA